MPFAAGLPAFQLRQGDVPLVKYAKGIPGRLSETSQLGCLQENEDKQLQAALFEGENSGKSTSKGSLLDRKLMKRTGEKHESLHMAGARFPTWATADLDVSNILDGFIQRNEDGMVLWMYLKHKNRLSNCIKIGMQPQQNLQETKGCEIRKHIEKLLGLVTGEFIAVLW